MKAVSEIVVHFESFTNIDLFNQGLYQLQVSVLSPSNNFAAPLSLDNSRSLVPLPFNPHFVLEGKLMSSERLIRSRVFMVRYAREKVKLNDSASFLLETPIDSMQKPITIQVDLLFAHINPQHASSHNPSFLRNLALLKVTSCTFQIAQPFQGVNHFLPVRFSKSWNSKVDAILHIVPLHYTLNTFFPSHTDSLTDQEINQLYNRYVSLFGEAYEAIRNTLQLLTQIDLAVRPPPILNLPLNSSHNLQTFSQVIGTNSCSKVGKKLTKELNTLSSSIRDLFQQLRDLTTRFPKESVKILHNKYNERVRGRFRQFIFVGSSSSDQLKDVHSSKSASVRKSAFYANLPKLRVHMQDYFPDHRSHPIIFEEINTSEKKPVLVSKHLIVLVHGFQGNSTDLIFYKNYIRLLYRKSEILESSYNEFKTDESIDEMGFRLAKEVITFLSESRPREAPRVSFIGHSLGGVIARAALPYLDCLKGRMHTFMSLSSPHLGLMKSSKLVKAGVWFLKKIKSSTSLAELTLEDFPLKECCYLYGLSLHEGLSWFAHVVLVGSAQDEYVPIHSTRVCTSGKEAYAEMAENLLSKVKKERVVRLDINFKIRPSIDSFIGRSAHMKMIESESAIRMIVHSYPEFFS